MAVRSMTGFAQVTAEAQDGRPGFTLTLKSVNHRFLDLGLRLPGDSEALDIRLRRALKEKISRGHVDVTVMVTPGSGQTAQINREVVGNYVCAFRAAAEMFGISAEPDLNVALRMPGAMNANTSNAGMSEALQDAVLQELDAAVAKLNTMREQEGEAIAQELRDRVGRLSAAVEQVAGMRERIAQAAYERLRTKMTELLSGTEINEDRVLQEAALMAERSDVQEELARLRSHIDHFLSLLNGGGEVGKKLDFLMQEFNREANTLLSKTTGIAGEGIKITELGLTMKSEIEKLREQVQNLE
jgi:uncharacterized protein (TIGR00255 family)